MIAYVRRDLSTDEFTEHYPEIWRELRDTHHLARENAYVQRALDCIFTAIDDADRSAQGDYTLWITVRATLNVIHGIPR
ncbi:colicin immunity domain-containing protein [Tahibacter amnicola]|uniref:Colicin immunity domain-containing protein n=1 Tax=Tahibacter amnicola TaxID=2976241 RepID=A0ABY6BL51_9GAMM|nr:colicin immunity domain-containing protein [Tahibacter amnicola]UXI70351.1 colicin immunity domain-containing protein [Tahibacter amnicola]